MQHKKPSWFLCSMMLSLFLGLGISIPAQASETIAVTQKVEGVLQDGGLLKEEPKQPQNKAENGIRANGASIAGAEEALERAIENFQTEVSLSAYGIEAGDIKKFYEDFVNNHPQYFYLDVGYGYSQNSSGIITALRVTYTGDSATIKKQVAAYEKKITQILAGANTSWSDWEKALYVNDYLALNCAYDKSLKKYNAYNALVEGSAVCQGYALAYLDLMNRLDIPCELVSSDALNHAWDLVQIGSSWYHVDVTWNDPTNDRYGRARHVYFLKSTNWFRSPSIEVRGHDANDYVYSGSAGDAQAKATTYDNSFWNDVDAPFCYYKGYWYGNQDGVMKQYVKSGAVLSEVKEIRKLEGVWHVWGSTAYWQGNFGSCNIFGNKLYYADPQHIYALNLDAPGAEPAIAYTLSAAEQGQGYLYGFYIAEGGVLKYEIARDPNNRAAAYGEVKVHTTHTPGKAATCTEPKTCTECHIVLKAATGHKAGKAATCTTPQTCTVCKVTLKAATGHLHTKTKTVKKATFVKTGTSQVICTDCGKKVKETKLAKVKCKKNAVYTVGNYKYKIISNKVNGKGTVSFAGLAKNVKKVAIGDTVTILGAKFKIVQIGDKALKNKTAVTSVTIGKNVQSIGKEAFYGTKKLKTITVKSQKLTKVGSKALKNTNAKLKIKVPKAKLKKYKSLLKNKGQKKTVKVHS